MNALIMVKWLKREEFRRWLLKGENFQKWLNPLKLSVRKWLRREHFRSWLNPLKLLKREDFGKWFNTEDIQRWLNPLKQLKTENLGKWLNTLKSRVGKWLKREENLYKFDGEMIRRLDRYTRGAIMCRLVWVYNIECQYADKVRKCCKEMNGVEAAEYEDEEKDILIVRGWFDTDDLRLRLLLWVYGVSENRIIRKVEIPPNITCLIRRVSIMPIEFMREPCPWNSYTEEIVRQTISKEALRIKNGFVIEY